MPCQGREREIQLLPPCLDAQVPCKLTSLYLEFCLPAREKLPHRPIITLTTDFGTNDHFVGAMKGVIVDIVPDVQIVDIYHAVQAFDVLAGALAISQGRTHSRSAHHFRALLSATSEQYVSRARRVCSGLGVSRKDGRFPQIRR